MNSNILARSTSNFPQDGQVSQTSTAFTDALKLSEKIEDDRFTFSLKPSHSKGNPLPDLDKIEIAMWKSEMNEATLNKHFPYRRPITVEVYALKGDPASNHISTKPINVNFSSPESFQQAREWIDNCLHNHPECPTTAVPNLPTRVVEVLDNESLRLHISGGKASYAALSYCWGKPQMFATTLSSIADLTQGFTLSALPLSLQDAIKLTIELGLKFIWIDSLCIIQDSPSDKEREISQMAQVYNNAYVTICAANAAACSESFLKPHGDFKAGLESSLSDDLMKMPYKCANGDFGTVLFREESPYHSMWEPISRRAWTLQERILSPRALIYGSRFLWQCHTAQHSDGGIEDWSFDVLGSGHRRFSSGAFGSTEPTRHTGIDFFSLRQVFQVWYSTVQEYTRRELTLPTDKLPAIAGMAKAFYDITGDIYLAGLWKSNLAHDLMWSSNPAIDFAKPSVWRAPSWSWASIDNGVSFDKITEDSTLLAKVLSCEVTPRSECSPFGEIAQGILVIDGPFTKADPEQVKKLMLDESMGPPPKENDATMWNKAILNMILNSGKQDHGDASGWKPPESVWCLLLYSRNWRWDSDYQHQKIAETCFSGLILEKIGNGEQYRRIGSFYNRRRDWLGYWDRQTITIV
ncbi:hypothetical protein MMC07_003252 [Pseudocyphellaria aurata]|nr:hypothetical protein [Pseudocyphellaria aurata]